MNGPLAKALVAAGVATLGLLASFAASAQGPARADAATDLTGAWHIAFPSPAIGQCSIAMGQDGATLSALAECDGTISRLRMSGSVDDATGGVHLQDPDYIQLDGVVSSAGNSIVGTYLFLSRPPKAFTATRDGSTPLIDLSGDWRLTLEGEPTKECTMHIDQSFHDASVQLTCGAMSDASITGEISPLSGSFGLSDPERHVENYINGRSSTDGKYLVGELGFDVDTLDFIAVKEGQDVSGLLAFACGLGTRPSCSADVGEPFTVQLRIADPPAGGYDGFHIGLAWDGAALGLRGKSSSGCQTAAFSIAQDHGTMDCSYDSTRQTTGVVAEAPFVCNRLGAAKLDLSGVTFLGPGGETITPSVVGGEVFCWTSSSSEPGDASCDGVQDSIDAALVLQYGAGLLPLTRCLALADINFDDEINAIDATIVLQLAAGLFAHLPP